MHYYIGFFAEFQRWRLICLALGMVLLFVAPIISGWVPFYYSSTMVIGILLVVIIILFQVLTLFKPLIFLFGIIVHSFFPEFPYLKSCT